MKYITLIFAIIIVVACGTQSTKNNRGIDETLQIEQIDNELSNKILTIKEHNSTYDIYSVVKDFAKILEHYLRYPQTYENDMPLLKKQMYIEKFPLSGNKLYSFWWYYGGTMGYSHNTYIQYRSKNGDIEFIPFLNDLRYPSSFDFYEFCYDNTIYYLVKQYSQGSSSIYSYYVAIISIKDGVITYHPEFFPAEFDFKPGIEEYFIYDDNGEIIDNTERPCYFAYVCGTQNANNNVDFTFDPNTLTLTVLDETDCSTGATTKSELKLNTKFEVND